MVLFADNSRRLQPIDTVDLPSFHGIGGGGGLWDGGFPVPMLANGGAGGGGSVGPLAQPSPAPPIDFDFDLSQISRAVAQGNTREDVLSAYEVFTTGTSRGRGLGYAQDVQRRFGAPSLRHAAASYLDAAGLPRLARIVSPDPAQPSPLPDSDDLGDFFSLPDPAQTQTPAPEKKSPVELLIDALPRLFGQATYNPPLQSQATGYTPVSGDFGSGSGAGAGGGVGLWLILAAVAVAGYFIYKRYASN